MREMIKSMREATMKSGLLDSAGNLSTDMLDQQLSVAMAGQPGGLTDAISKQLARSMGSRRRRGSEIAVPSTLSLSRNAWRNVGSSGAWSGSRSQAAIDQRLCTGSQGARQLRDGAHRRSAAWWRERHPGPLHDRPGRA
jgi:Rod binding domain-containing protein